MKKITNMLKFLFIAIVINLCAGAVYFGYVMAFIDYNLEKWFG